MERNANAYYNRLAATVEAFNERIQDDEIAEEEDEELRVVVTYGLCRHHVTNAQILVKTGRLNHDAAMRHLKAVYEGRKRIYDSLHAEDKPLTGGY